MIRIAGNMTPVFRFCSKLSVAAGTHGCHEVRVGNSVGWTVLQVGRGFRLGMPGCGRQFWSVGKELVWCRDRHLALAVCSVHAWSGHVSTRPTGCHYWLEVIHWRKKSVKLKPVERRQIGSRILPLVQPSGAHRRRQLRLKINRCARRTDIGKHGRGPRSCGGTLQMGEVARGRSSVFLSTWKQIARDRHCSPWWVEIGWGGRYWRERVGESRSVFVSPGSMLLQRLEIHQFLTTQRAPKLRRHAVVMASSDVRTQTSEMCKRCAAVPADVRPATTVDVYVFFQRMLEAVGLGTVRACKLAVGGAPEFHRVVVGRVGIGWRSHRERGRKVTVVVDR